MTSSLRWEDLEFVRLLGQGQAGQVWLANVRRAADGLRVGDQVAVKRYKRWVLQEPGQYERIYRELAASLTIRHPNVVQNICFVSDEALPALVMKYYEGRTLESVLDEMRASGARLPLTDAFRLLDELVGAVKALHGHGIYHRDIKPANIFVESASGSAVMMDLGVVSEFLMPEQTQTANFLGTIRYAEPGYLTGEPFTQSCDWYSLGLVAYELFFTERFLGSEQQWARVVARKVSSRLPSSDDLAEKHRRLSDSLGRNAAEAVFYALETLLADSTAVRLDSVQAGIAAQFWTKPFFEQSNREIRMGEPGAAFVSRDVSDFADRDDLFPAYLRERYWMWRASAFGERPSTGRFDSYAVYRSGGGDDTTYDYLDIDAEIMALHRYGYL